MKLKTLKILLQSLNFAMYVRHHSAFSHAFNKTKFHIKYMDNLYLVINHRRSCVVVRHYSYMG